jgi:flagellar basal-body rod modification protein FlgD
MIANDVSSSTTRTAAATTAAEARNALGKDQFLKLLTAQLANQDPLQPVDNQAFIAQLAQFSSLEQLQGVSSRLDSLLLATASSNQLGTAALVGKTVSYRSDGVDVVDGKPSPLRASLATPAAVTLLVQDASGRTVRTLSLGQRGAGAFEVGWDGRDDRGNTVAPGHYTVKAAARAADGSNPAVEVRAAGQVQGVNFGSDGAQLMIGGARVKMSDVLEITQS